MSYSIKFTDKRKTPIVVDSTDIDSTLSISLFGRGKLSYGEALQGNLLHILENFACPEDATTPGTPDKTVSYVNIFDNPIEGQFWYNTTQKLLNYYNGTVWVPIAADDSIAANWGVIADKQYLPKPVSELTGRVFDYSECVWIVSPATIPEKIDFLACSTNDSAYVNMRYRIKGTDNVISGLANYLIVGIAGNVNQPEPIIQLTTTPTPTPTGTVGASLTPAPTVTPTSTPAPTQTRTYTPVPSITPSPTPAATRTPAPSTQQSPTPAATNTPSPTPAVTNSMTPSPSPQPKTLTLNGQTYTNTFNVPYGAGGTVMSRQCSLNLVANSSGWSIIRANSGAGGSSSTIASGTFPTTASTIQFATVYRPDLCTVGNPSPGTLSNNATSPVPIANGASVNVTSVSQSSANGQDHETAYSIQVIIYDTNGNTVSNSICYFDVDIVGSA